MAFPVECMIPYDEDDPSTHVVLQNIFRFGQVRYDRRKSDGRRIVEFPTQEMQKEAIGKNPPGPPMFVIPTDIVSEEEEENIRRIVRDEFAKLTAGQQSAETPVDPGHDIRPNATTHAVSLARENAIDIESIEGTGNDGQVTKSDVEKAIEAATE